METEYNIDGNPVKRISCDKNGKNREVRIWEYDYLGYLRQAISEGFRYRYEFRPDGKLLRKETSGQAMLCYTRFPDGNTKTRTDGHGRVLSYGYDHGGRLTSVADEVGEIVSYCHTPGEKVKEIRHRNKVRTAYEYDAFGMIRGRHKNVPNRLLYGGQQYDTETEQYYLRARYYNPVTGRFMQEDTCRGDGLNLYAYCANCRRVNGLRFTYLF